MKIAVWVLFRLFIDSNERCNTVNAPSTGLSSIHFSNTPNFTFDDPERPEGIDNCTKDEERGDFLRLPHLRIDTHFADIHGFMNVALVGAIP